MHLTQDALRKPPPYQGHSPDEPSASLALRARYRIPPPPFPTLTAVQAFSFQQDPVSGPALRRARSSRSTDPSAARRSLGAKLGPDGKTISDPLHDFANQGASQLLSVAAQTSDYFLDCASKRTSRPGIETARLRGSFPLGFSSADTTNRDRTIVSGFPLYDSF